MLDADDIEAIAQRVAQLVGDRPVFPQVGYVDVATVARLTGMSDYWVRKHAAELGAVRMGAGAGGDLRFDMERVHRWLDEHRLRPDQPKQRRTGGPARRPSGLDLLPIPDKVGRR